MLVSKDRFLKKAIVVGVLVEATRHPISPTRCEYLPFRLSSASLPSIVGLNGIGGHDKTAMLTDLKVNPPIVTCGNAIPQE